jgi:hypothetical protein
MQVIRCRQGNHVDVLVLKHLAQIRVTHSGTPLLCGLLKALIENTLVHIAKGHDLDTGDP